MSDDALATLAANMKRLINRVGGVYSSNEAAQKGSQGRVSRSTFDRLRNIDKAGSTAVGIDKLDGVAKTFGIEVWQLFVPDLDIKSPPKLAKKGLDSASDIFETVDLYKISKLDKNQLATLEGALIYAASHLGVDIKKNA